MDQISELERALRALAEAFEREGKSPTQQRDERMAARRAAAQTRMMAGIARRELTMNVEPDEEQVASARAWLSSGTEQVQIMQARRYARSIPATS